MTRNIMSERQAEAYQQFIQVIADENKKAFNWHVDFTNPKQPKCCFGYHHFYNALHICQVTDLQGAPLAEYFMEGLASKIEERLTTDKKKGKDLIRLALFGDYSD